MARVVYVEAILPREERRERRVEVFQRSQLTDELAEWTFSLLKENMKTIYEKGGWGWDDSKKKKNFSSKRRFLIAFADEKPVGFSHFRFEVEGQTVVLYIYELQIHADFRSKGIGKHMTGTLELMAGDTKWNGSCHILGKTEFEKVFMDQMRYAIDETFLLIQHLRQIRMKF